MASASRRGATTFPSPAPGSLPETRSARVLAEGVDAARAAALVRERQLTIERAILEEAACAVDA